MAVLIYKYEIPTRYDELTLKVEVSTIIPQKLRLIVYDKKLPNTVFTNRYKTVDGNYTFYVRMPLSGSTTIIEIYNDNIDYNKNNSLFDVQLNKISIINLNKNLSVIDFSNPYIRSFIGLCNRFCFNAGYLPPNNYVSDDKKFLIRYMPTLLDEDGNEVSTPARIDISNGTIEVSQKKFVNLTVPNRKAIMYHEFSHYYLNENMDDEVEADLNGLNIYLGEGNPRVEAFEVFADTFINAPTEENKERYDKITDFIQKFDNLKMNLYD